MNVPIPLVCTVHQVSLVWLPGDDKGIANLLSCREWGAIYNLFLYIISWDQCVAGVLCPARVHPSVSMTSKSVICSPFLCPIPFFFKTLDLFSIPLLSILSLFSALLSPWKFLSIFFTLSDLLQFIFSTYRTICMSENQLWKLHVQIKPCC